MSAGPLHNTTGIPIPRGRGEIPGPSRPRDRARRKVCVSRERLETADYRRVAGAARVVPDEIRVEIPSFMLPSCGAGGDHPVSCCAASPPGCGSGGGRNRPRGPIRRPAGAGAAERKRSLRGPIVARRSEGRAIWMNHEVEILRRSRPGRKTKDGTIVTPEREPRGSRGQTIRNVCGGAMGGAAWQAFGLTVSRLHHASRSHRWEAGTPSGFSSRRDLRLTPLVPPHNRVREVPML